ncbi:hypothetical protein [Nonomuraea gerenzanensis]|uniref:Uncharacterized protein n=1 Tax=Nonomuraea gerenzanensis TaxID=93944 RepID=A0A1M4EG52_9ACTN|nr:hypothetical protein [Nonomuraea gerenzanensis]UBU09479.1 hypothetical protein LCN96_34590 [Nonomuraea gerenzanensis]SBO97895.1 hypothetical protein BN4615_P7411 [Nonomuraea gerenzanensis]
MPLIAVLTGGEEEARPRPAVSRSPVREAVSVTPNAVYPAARVEGGTGSMRVTFPDGSRAEITYPARLSLASLGARPYVGGTLTGDGGAEFRALTAPLYGEAETPAGREMIRPLTANVGVWPGPPGVDTAGQVLLFRFGVWRVGGLSRRMLVVAPVPGCGRLGRTPVVLDARHAIAGSTCRDGFHLAASGDRDFVREAIEHVRVRPA